jgi:hypothetical protein
MAIFRHRGNFNHIEKFFNHVRGAAYLNILDKYGQEGVNALSASTPVDSGKTASSWTYEIQHSKSATRISWLNTNVNQNVSVALILQYGHGTGTGGYVTGIDYINPAMKPIFEHIAEEAWKEVTAV